ncbi:hypothetical protein V9T40_002874 [Parthenolecanium corni]|uniref:Uncharacterized protein n=1 Tax=Parthenolecanium corni TaxID=536013 RepID=A0AAN9TXM1_9HEMI
MLQEASMTIVQYKKQYSAERPVPMNTTTAANSLLDDDPNHRKLTLNLSRNADCAGTRAANHFNFSVAALLADTRERRHSKSPSPSPSPALEQSATASSEDDIPDEDLDMLESGDDEENIDVEAEAAVKRSVGSPNRDCRTPPQTSLNSFLQQAPSSIMAARFMLGSPSVPPVRPMPLGAYQHAVAAAFGLPASWPSVHGPYTPPGSVFPSFTNNLPNSPGKSM